MHIYTKTEKLKQICTKVAAATLAPTNGGATTPTSFKVQVRANKIGTLTRKANEQGKGHIRAISTSTLGETPQAARGDLINNKIYEESNLETFGDAQGAIPASEDTRIAVNGTIGAVKESGTEQADVCCSDFFIAGATNHIKANISLNNTRIYNKTSR